MTKQTISQTRHGTEPDPDDSAVEEPVGGTDWTRLKAMTTEEALRNALNDPDSQPLTPELRARLRHVPNPQKIRAMLGLTQEEFSRRFEIALGTLRDWEQGVRIPDSTAKAYLRVIEQSPDAVVDALSRSYRSKAPAGQ
jgi:putative transcriptional regulator